MSLLTAHMLLDGLNNDKKGCKKGNGKNRATFIDRVKKRVFALARLMEMEISYFLLLIVNAIAHFHEHLPIIRTGKMCKHLFGLISGVDKKPLKIKVNAELKAEKIKTS